MRRVSDVTSQCVGKVLVGRGRRQGIWSDYGNRTNSSSFFCLHCNASFVPVSTNHSVHPDLSIQTVNRGAQTQAETYRFSTVDHLHRHLQRPTHQDSSRGSAVHHPPNPQPSFPTSTLRTMSTYADKPDKPLNEYTIPAASHHHDALANAECHRSCLTRFTHLFVSPMAQHS